MSVATASRRELPLRYEADRLADEIAVFRQQGCRGAKKAFELVTRACDLAFNGVAGEGSELAAQLREWRDLLLGTDEDRDLTRLPHLFTVAPAISHDPVCGRLAHCAVLSHILMYDESTRGFLADHWGLKPAQLTKAWKAANDRRTPKLKLKGKKAAKTTEVLDAASYYAALEDLIRFHLKIFSEPRIELRGNTLWVGPRPVKLANRYAAVIAHALNSPNRRVDRSELAALGVKNAAMIRQRIADALKKRGVIADMRTQHGDFVLHSVQFAPLFR